MPNAIIRLNKSDREAYLGLMCLDFVLNNILYFCAIFYLPKTKFKSLNLITACIAANAATTLVSLLGALLIISFEEKKIASESLATGQPIGHIVECNDDTDIKKLEFGNLRTRLTEYLPSNETLTTQNYTFKDAITDEKRLHYISVMRTVSSAWSIFASLDILTHGYKLNFYMRLLALTVTTALFTPKIYKGYSCLFKASIDSYSNYFPQPEYTGLFFSRKLEDLEIDVVKQGHAL